ncbi:AbrB/MazE/SpoVT family DNA-binding domain-containing protein [Candidatus Kaiserbacteria bacterium]|nr:AbrB/MazE/SpoVT family DNA-binding domain-containing protein [Candidatus Kaiserbacteria bacterium]
MFVAISKITRGGQITLPKKIRARRAFADVRAVVFEERGEEIVLKPLRASPARDLARDHLPIAEYTMREWLDDAHDDLSLGALIGRITKKNRHSHAWKGIEPSGAEVWEE